MRFGPATIFRADFLSARTDREGEFGISCSAVANQTTNDRSIDLVLSISSWEETIFGMPLDASDPSFSWLVGVERRRRRKLSPSCSPTVAGCVVASQKNGRNCSTGSSEISTQDSRKKSCNT